LAEIALIFRVVSKGIFGNGISQFESYQASQPVRTLYFTWQNTQKTPQMRAFFALAGLQESRIRTNIPNFKGKSLAFS